jgi:hypothetical protein
LVVFEIFSVERKKSEIGRILKIFVQKSKKVRNGRTFKIFAEIERI